MVRKPVVLFSFAGFVFCQKKIFKYFFSGNVVGYSICDFYFSLLRNNSRNSLFDWFNSVYHFSLSFFCGTTGTSEFYGFPTMWEVLEFSLNGTEIQWIQGIWWITEAWIGLNLKILSLTFVLLALSLSGLLHKRWLGGRLKSFYCSVNFLLLNLLDSVKTFMENWIVQEQRSECHTSFASKIKRTQLLLVICFGFVFR